MMNIIGGNVTGSGKASMQMTIAVMEKGKTMSDYISKDVLFETIEELTWYHLNEVLGKMIEGANTHVNQPYYKSEDVFKAIDTIPSIDAVKVVRCKDCKYLKPFTSQYGAGQFCECPCSFGGQGIKKPDDYCSYGERRDDREYKDSILNARKGEE